MAKMGNQINLLSIVTFAVGIWISNLSIVAAQTSDTGRSGDWINYEGRSEDGRRLCGFRSRGQVRSVHFKKFEGDDFFVIQLFNHNWRFSERASVQISMRLGGERWEWFGDTEPSRPSRLRSSTPVPHVVTFPIPHGQWASFWNAFRWASEGTIDFLTGNEASWPLSLIGSNVAVLRYQDCVSRTGVETRPFDLPRVNVNPGAVNPGPKTIPREGGIKSPF
jgi:hypothetical protein